MARCVRLDEEIYAGGTATAAINGLNQEVTRWAADGLLLSKETLRKLGVKMLKLPNFLKVHQVGYSCH